MRKRWIAGIVVFVLVSTLLLPQLAADMDFIFSRKYDSLTMNPKEGWAAVLGGGNVLKFYLFLVAAVVLFLAWVLFTGSYLNYRSNMQFVTPDIVTPCADGQGQFGTARWLPKEAIGKFFDIWKIPKKDTDFEKLIAAGKEDYREVKNAKL